MPRERDRKRAPSSDRRRTGAVLLQLGWLEGYPDEGGWRTLDDDTLIPLDGATVAKARRAARTAMREHPAGLAKVVGDVERWWAIVDVKLAWMSAAIAGKGGAFDPIPLLAPRAAAALRALLPSPVGGAARAVAIGLASRPDRLAELLGWLAEHRDLVLVDLPVPTDRVILALARLAVLGDRGKARAVRERGVEALIRLCRVDAPNPAAALQASRAAENRLREQGSKKSEPQAHRSPAHVVPWLVQLATRDAVHRQRTLALLGSARLAEALEPWQVWEREHAALVERARALAESRFESSPERSAAEVKLIDKLVHSRKTAPVELSLRDALRELDMLAGDAFARVQPALVRLLAAVPAELGVAAPARMLLHAARAAATADDNEHFDWVWDALADALERGASVELLGPWRGIMNNERLYVESDLFVIDHVTRRSDIARTVRVAVALASAGPLGKDDLDRVATWLAAGLTDEAMVREVVVAMREVGDDLGLEIARAALALAPAVGGLAATAARLIELAADWDHATTRAVSALIEHAVATGGAWLIAPTVIDGRATPLAELAEVLALMPRARWPRLTRDLDAPAWIARYPAALHVALHRLASVDPEAERTAGRRLASDLPDPAALRAEIAALRGKLDRAGAAKRLANLEARLADPKLPSPARLATLASKLEHSARDIGIRRFADALTHGAIERVCRAFGLATLPAWAAGTPKTIGVLFALLSLDERDRELAGRMIRARGGAPPWDLRDEPVNRAFLDAARAAGLDPAPWLDDAPRTIRLANGDSFTLELTGDPIEVFAMGAHFDTCLAPDGGNFFSVVANAADVNKRVLYARRDGRVIGRCLLALTDQFAILTFHVYSHEPIALEGHVRAFVVDLARRMNTIVVPRGSVTTLLARDWYDDGPRDLVGRLRALDDAGLDFATLEPQAVVGVIRAALDRPIDDVTLPMILGYHGLHQRPELVVPLAPYILASTVPTTRMMATQLALQAGDRALADRFLGDYYSGGQWLRHNAWYHGETLAQLRPSFTLDRLRKTRGRDVRSWEDELGDRCAVAALALETLNRPKQALAMYRLAAKESWVEPLIRNRLAALERRS